MQEYLNAFDQINLQVLNNFILLNSFEENNGQLFSHIFLLIILLIIYYIYLFLLNSTYDVTKTQSFDIQREHISKLTYEIKNQNSIYQLGYKEGNSKFKVRIK